MFASPFRRLFTQNFYIFFTLVGLLNVVTGCPDASSSQACATVPEKRPEVASEVQICQTFIKNVAEVVGPKAIESFSALPEVVWKADGGQKLPGR